MQGEVLHVTVPAGADHPMIRVLKDGREIAKQEGHSLELPVLGPGTIAQKLTFGSRD